MQDNVPVYAEEEAENSVLYGPPPPTPDAFAPVLYAIRQSLKSALISASVGRITAGAKREEEVEDDEIFHDPEEEGPDSPEEDANPGSSS